MPQTIFQGLRVDVWAESTNSGFSVHFTIDGSVLMCDHPPIHELAQAKAAWIEWVKSKANEALFIYTEVFSGDDTGDMRSRMLTKLGFRKKPNGYVVLNRSHFLYE